MSPRIAQALTLGLAGAAALLLVLVVALWFGVGRGYSWWPLDPAAAAAEDKKLANPQFRLGDWDKFADLVNQPLFNEDRKPTPPMSPESQSGPSQVRQLDVVLAGVIITPKLRLALVKEKGKEKSMSVKEGGSLPGDWAGWSLAELKPRGAVFKNSAGQSETLELIAVATSQKPTAPPPPHVTPPPAPATAPAPPAQAQAQAQAQQLNPFAPAPAPALPTPVQPGGGTGDAAAAAAADLQQRIDARRQQIREQQEQQQHQGQDAPARAMPQQH